MKSTCALGREIMFKNPNAHDVKDKVKKLEEEERILDEMWANRQKQLQDAYDLQVWLSKIHLFQFKVLRLYALYVQELTNSLK